MSSDVIDEQQILFLHHLQFLADFCNQHDRVAPAFKASDPSTPDQHDCDGKAHFHGKIASGLALKHVGPQNPVIFYSTVP